MIRPQDLPERIRDYSQPQVGQTEKATNLVKRLEKEEWPQLAEIEGQYVARVLAHTDGNKQAASRLLGIDRKTLDRMIKRHDIKVPRKKAAGAS